MQAALIGPSGQTILGSTGLTIGRIQSNQYVVYDRRVSARHAVISFLKQGYFTITDIGSTNGTFVNGLLLTHNIPHVLHAVIRFVSVTRFSPFKSVINSQ